MLCPFCLARKPFQKTARKSTAGSVYRCPSCKEQIPALYTREYKKYPPLVVNAIGFRQHGKTVYFASLFYVLKNLTLAKEWPKFYTMSLNEDSLNTVYENVALLESGLLPDSTPKNFPRPTMVRVNGMPFYPDCTLLCYDTGGECFERSSQLVQYAGFVRRSITTLFLISINDLENPAKEMFKLLNTYIVGMSELGAETREQNLVVVFTKADGLLRNFSRQIELQQYLKHGSVTKIFDQENYVKEMLDISNQLIHFTRDDLNADEFMNAVQNHFLSVSFSMVSALGAKPDGNRLPANIVPSLVLDPLFMMMEQSQPKLIRLLKTWFA
ncbi:MAG: hypothetical protein GY869_28575 [Planctomycetes bacterium]|nr:hypothetical protein [Planctomycetota bacterium]